MSQALKNTVGFDIETIPGQDSWIREYYDAKIEEPKPPGNYKSEEAIAKWKRENPRENLVEEALEKTVFEGATNHIIALSWNVGGVREETLFLGSDLSKEGDLLQTFFDDIANIKAPYQPTFYGHNIAAFDLRVIKQRAMVLGIKPPPVFPVDFKPWDKHIYDTMLKWGNGRDYVKLDLIARAFGIQGKEGMDGSKVYGAWKEGRYREIADYCAADVRMTVEVYKRMIFAQD